MHIEIPVSWVAGEGWHFGPRKTFWCPSHRPNGLDHDPDDTDAAPEDSESARETQGKADDTAGGDQKNAATPTWFFECHCGVAGRDYDDGTDMRQCGDCGTWQHALCPRPAPRETIADPARSGRDDFYRCTRCPPTK